MSLKNCHNFSDFRKLAKKKLPSPVGLINLNLNYKYTGKYIDWDGSANSKQMSHLT